MEYELNLREKIFRRLYCYPLPDHEEVADKEKEDNINPGSLERFEKYFGNYFFDKIKGKVLVDIGCGEGAELISIVKKGAKYGIGIDIQENYLESVRRAEALGLGDKIRYTTDPLSEMAPSSVDVIISQNSFEHIEKPEDILSDAYSVLKPGGKFFITFSPPWLHPYGVHMFFMIKRPWAHLIFSESTILNVRRLYRSDGATCYEEVEGGLNKMTIKKFVNYIGDTPFVLEYLNLNPIRGLPTILTKIPFVKEFVTGAVSAVLAKTT